MKEMIDFQKWITNPENTSTNLKLFSGSMNGKNLHPKKSGSHSAISKIDNLVCAELNELICHIEGFIEFLLTNDIGKEFILKKKNRIRLLGYFLNSCFWIACVSDRVSSNAENIIEDMLAQLKCDEFDYESEIAEQKWVVPLTGNLYVDAMTNFYARNLEQCDPEEYLSRLSMVCITQNLLFTKHAFYGGMGPLGCSVLSGKCNEQQFRDIIDMVSGKNGEKQRKPSAKINIKAALIAAYIARNGGWKERCRTPLHEHSSSNGKFSYCPAESVVDTRAVAPEKAWSGVHFDGCMSNKVRQAFASNDKNIDIDWETGNNVRVWSHLAALYNKERQDLAREKKRIALEKKTRKEKEQNLLKLKNELQMMSQKVTELSSATKLSSDIQREAEKSTAKLKSRIEHLEIRAEKIQQERDGIAAELEKASRLIESLKTEVSALQKIAQENVEADCCPEELDTSIFDKLSIVIYGGFPAWEKGMASLHPNIVIFGSQSPMPLEQISKADVVWLQTNCMSHAQFDRISAAVSATKTPLRYFTHAGHTACKKQIIEETRIMVEGGIFLQADT